MTTKQIDVGQDSFLDIVANLVGILIILVVVVGAQAKASWHDLTESQDSNQAAVTELESQMDTAQHKLVELSEDNQRLEQQIVREVQLANLAAKKRHEILVRIELAERELAEKNHQLQSEEQRRLRQLAKADQLKQKLRETEAMKSSLEHVRVQRETIEHYPTPIAKTVFSDEIHFRLSQGRIAFVPLDELVERMKSEWNYQANAVKTGSKRRQTVGPIRDFRLQYELESFVAPRNPGSTNGQQGVRFKRFVILPIRENLGETVQNATMNGSAFQKQLDRKVAEKTTVSIWVYPDSYSELAELKSWLRKQGFQTASWPLDSGKHISGGPDGFQTAAQ